MENHNGEKAGKMTDLHMMDLQNNDSISQSMNTEQNFQFDNKLSTKTVNLSMTQKHNSMKSERINLSGNDRMALENMTEQTLIDHSNMLDESGQMIPPFTVRGVEIVK